MDSPPPHAVADSQWRWERMRSGDDLSPPLGSFSVISSAGSGRRARGRCSGRHRSWDAGRPWERCSCPTGSRLSRSEGRCRLLPGWFRRGPWSCRM